MSAKERISIAVEVERRPARSFWHDHVWRVVALGPGRSDLPDWSLLSRSGEVLRFYAGTADLMVHSGDTKAYKDNIEAPAPSVYVVLRRAPTALPWRLALITADPNEAHAHADVGDDLVEALPMPEPVVEWISRFIARYHVEKTEWKRTRDRADPNALGRKQRLPEDGHE